MRNPATTEAVTVPHTWRYERPNGTVVYVTDAHRARLYKRGRIAPNYPVPMVIADARPRDSAPPHAQPPVSAPHHHEKLICAAVRSRAMLLGMVRQLAEQAQ